MDRSGGGKVSSGRDENSMSLDIEGSTGCGPPGGNLLAGQHKLWTCVEIEDFLPG
jgi:hypothetical protein